MCVIIKKTPGSEVPFEHLLASAHRNKDGFGVVVDAGGKLEMFSGLETDPEKAAQEVSKILGDAKEELAYVHFRLRTRGSIDKTNLQPIPLLSKDKGDTMDMCFLHNGTISDLRAASMAQGPSDSLVFANTIVEPLVRRSAAYRGDEHVLTDPLIPAILQAYGDWSRFALLDSLGNDLIVNKKSGSDQTYGWVSNAASIDPKNYENKASSSRIIYPAPFITKPDTEKIEDKMRDNLFKSQENLRTAPQLRETLKTSTGFCLEDFHYLSEDEIDDLVDTHPRLATLLILDLIEHHYTSTEARYD